MMTLGQMHVWLRGARLVGDPSIVVQRVHTDTRTLQRGDLFVALRGENFDANDFLMQAREAGAVGVIAERSLDQAGLCGLEVADSRVALGVLAMAWRSQFQLPLIAVTGSNGKTTVTQMIASILRAWKGEAAFATQGNLNNDVGVPLTLLRLRTGHQVAVVELGMNHPGEIARLAVMAQATVALVNNAQREHQEFMASVEAVARENGCAINALDRDGVAVFPADDVYTPMWREFAGPRKTLTFALLGPTGADIQGTAVWSSGAWQATAKTPDGELHFSLQIAGLHNVKNALAAITCAIAVGAPASAIVQGLNCFEPVKGRSRAFELRVGNQLVTVVDDTYNANPDSVRAAIDVLAALPGPRLLVLGDMGEVGEQGPAFHAEAGAYARAQGIETLLTSGELAQHMGGTHFADVASLTAAVASALPTSRSVLVKGSRFMKMERVVEAIVAAVETHSRETAHAA